MKRNEIVKGSVTPEIKRVVRQLAKETHGGESGVVRQAVEQYVTYPIIAGRIGREHGSRPPKRVRRERAERRAAK